MNKGREIKYEVLVQVWRITEIRGDAVYETEKEGELQWIPLEQRDACAPEGYIYSPPSTSVPLPWIRVKKEEK